MLRPTRPRDLNGLRQNEEFADADLARELWDLTRTANRANVTIYTIDPRGLVGPLSDIDDNVDPQQWGDFIRKSQDTLRTLAEDTGGIAVVNMNDFGKAIRRIRRQTSDHCNSSGSVENPDPLRKNRRLEVSQTAGCAAHLPEGILDQTASLCGQSRFPRRLVPRK